VRANATMCPPVPTAAPGADVVVLLPVYRNAAALPELAHRLTRALAPTGLDYRLLFVVDASPDDAWRVVQALAVQDARVAGLLLATNQGQHRALLTGMAHVHARWVAVMDADLQDPPELLPELIDACAASDLTVFARRRGAYQSPGRMWTSRLFKSLLGWLLRMPADVGTFLVIPRQVCVRMCQARIGHPQVVVMARFFSPGWRGVPFVRERRLLGSSAYSAMGRVRAAVRSLRCAWECRQARATGTRPGPDNANPCPTVVAARVNL
jgi:glycosyltransferase involved in cell wall biosynthesis